MILNEPKHERQTGIQFLDGEYTKDSRSENVINTSNVKDTNDGME